MVFIPDRIPPDGRRAAIIRAVAQDFRTTSFVDRYVRRNARLRDHDAAVQRMKTTSALRDLKRRGLVARTPFGWRATRAGLDLLRVSEAR